MPYRLLAAGTTDPGLPLAYLSNGGYDYTGNVVAPTRVPDTGTIQSIAFPHRISADDPETQLMTDATLARIQAAREARHERLMDAATLPREQLALNQLFESRLGSNDLRRLVNTLPSEQADGNLPRQAQVALAPTRPASPSAPT